MTPFPIFITRPSRFAALERAIAADAAGRAGAAKAEIEFALARKSMTRALLDADLPERVTHNDTKINNVLLDEQTGRSALRHRPGHDDAGPGAL